MDEINLRGERSTDAAAIDRVIRHAYAAVPYSDHREHLMVERLRASDAFVPELSILAEIGSEVVGHILLTKAEIGSGATARTTLALAPLSVVPEFQNMGVGMRLVDAAHMRAAASGFRSIVLVGIAGYYHRFGYEKLSRYPITLPFDAPPENCMILALAPGALDGTEGMVRYADAWLNH